VRNETIKTAFSIRYFVLLAPSSKRPINGTVPLSLQTFRDPESKECDVKTFKTHKSLAHFLVVCILCTGGVIFADSNDGPTFGTVTVSPGVVQFTFTTAGTFTFLGKVVAVPTGGALPVDNLKPGDYQASVTYSDGESELQKFSITSGSNLSIVFTHRLSKVYLVGDVGPAGGTVFYDKGKYESGWRYIEVSPQKLATRLNWIYNKNPIQAEICKKYSLGNTNDWSLPTIEDFRNISESIAKQKKIQLVGWYWIIYTDDDFVEGMPGNFMTGRGSEVRFAGTKVTHSNFEWNDLEGNKVQDESGLGFLADVIAIRKF
jgi:hypothetical protein